MVQRVATVAFEGVEARPVDVQVQVAPGLPAFNLVGLADKAVTEAKERVRAALIASSLAGAAAGRSASASPLPGFITTRFVPHLGQRIFRPAGGMRFSSI